MGRLVLCAPYPPYVQHHRIATVRTDLATRIQEELAWARREGYDIRPSKKDERLGITDAGHFVVSPDSKAVTLYLDSHGYGPVDNLDKARSRTVEILGGLLGSGIRVEQFD